MLLEQAGRTAAEPSGPDAPTTPGAWSTGTAACWAGLAALGAGLVHLALASQNRAVVPALVGFALLGAYLLLWGLGALGRARLPLPRTTGTVLVLAVGALTVLTVRGSVLVVGPDHEAGMAVAGAGVLQLVALAGLVLARRFDGAPHQARSGRTADRRTGPAETSRRLGLLAVGAVLTAAIATPALADTTAGDYARPHGGHLFPGLHEHH